MESPNAPLATTGPERASGRGASALSRRAPASFNKTVEDNAPPAVSAERVGLFRRPLLYRGGGCQRVPHLLR